MHAAVAWREEPRRVTETGPGRVVVVAYALNRSGKAFGGVGDGLAAQYHAVGVDRAAQQGDRSAQRGGAVGEQAHGDRVVPPRRRSDQRDVGVGHHTGAYGEDRVPPNRPRPHPLGTTPRVPRLLAGLFLVVAIVNAVVATCDRVVWPSLSPR